MKVNSSLSTKRKRPKAGQNRADVIVHRSIDTLNASRPPVERVLVIDIGGRSVKILATGQMQSRSFWSGPTLTPARMVEGVKKLAADWTHDVVSIGYRGPVLVGRLGSHTTSAAAG
jgi:polyphosphate glucokinase